MSRNTIKHLLISSGCLLLSAGIVFFAVFTIHKEEGTLATQVSVLAEEQSQENTHYRLKKIFEETTVERNQISKYFLRQGSDSIDFLNKVEAIAPQAGVSLRTDSLEEFSDKKTGAKWIIVKFSFSGDQRDTERFVTILEQLPYFSQVTQVTTQSKAPEGWEATVSMRVFLTP
jgi:hypothetical protein